MSSQSYDADLAQHGLVGSRLGARHIFESSAAVVFGIFTSLLFARLDRSVSHHRMQQYTLMSVAVAMTVFAAISAFIRSGLSRELRTYSQEYWQLLLDAERKIAHTALFLLTHFLSSSFVKTWSDMQMSAAESFDAMWRIFIAVCFVMQLFKKNADAKW